MSDENYSFSLSRPPFTPFEEKDPEVGVEGESVSQSLFLGAPELNFINKISHSRLKADSSL